MNPPLIYEMYSRQKIDALTVEGLQSQKLRRIQRAENQLAAEVRSRAGVQREKGTDEVRTAGALRGFLMRMFGIYPAGKNIGL